MAIRISPVLHAIDNFSPFLVTANENPIVKNAKRFASYLHTQFVVISFDVIHLIIHAVDFKRRLLI